MNKWQTEVAESLLESEEAAIKELTRQYRAALNEINRQIEIYDMDISKLDFAIDNTSDATQRALLESKQRSRIYRKQYQESLRGQISGILDNLTAKQYGTIEKYLNDSYTSGYVGAMYDISGQLGAPIVVPISQEKVIKAVLTDSKINGSLYESLSLNVKTLKKTIASEVSRGIATGMSYNTIALNIANASKAPLARAKTIARTEGHRIQNSAANDSAEAAKSKGADVVNQWDSTLDGNTRPNHRLLDGQLRAVGKSFEVGGKSAKYPGAFGDPAEDCNCRCRLLTRARAALDADELQALKDRAEYFGLDKTKDFEDFKKKYLKADKTVENTEINGIMKEGEKGRFVLDSNGNRIKAEIKPISEKEIKGMKKTGGWHANWEELSTRNEIFGLYTEDGKLQSAIAAHADKSKGVVYINWIVNAPANAPGNADRTYFETAEPLHAKAITMALDNGFGGLVAADASNKQLVKYYTDKWGARAGGYSDSAYPVYWDGQACIAILRKFGYIK